MKLLLASQSPRRKELLSSLGFEFEVVKIDCEEILPEHIKIEEAAAYLAELKASAFRNLAGDEVLLTADTVVAIDHQFLGKPRMKRMLSICFKAFPGEPIRYIRELPLKQLIKPLQKQMLQM
jgi:predicted house-cleaning NTP pyrophosphatase (Maf/HAM1 superfamily)